MSGTYEKRPPVFRVMVVVMALALLGLSSLQGGCAWLPERPAVETPTERLGEVLVGISAADVATAEALDAGRISSETGAEVLSAIDEVREAADAAAAALRVTEGGTAPEQLKRAERLLLELEARLREEGVNE